MDAHNDTRRDLEWLRRSSAATLSRPEAAEVMGVDTRTLGRGIESGDIPAIRVGRRVLIPREPLLRLLGAD
ncbi:excisionase family DNA-binding protein [Tsukamurella paurometabola]|uniref:Excisionase family DNA-binding protein n=1 Tax=Tsukamurella paurometabola TaxID=2061 RepID=A0ABS5NHZ2_TSUPA|nr:excisionase family DNA-binding protein [Tsukamurella paurometabola]MBS4103884.1 excisionase family DNA-binding protein [Tsukamurella paurometabola]